MALPAEADPGQAPADADNARGVHFGDEPMKLVVKHTFLELESESTPAAQKAEVRRRARSDPQMMLRFNGADWLGDDESDAEEAEVTAPAGLDADVSPCRTARTSTASFNLLDDEMKSMPSETPMTAMPSLESPYQPNMYTMPAPSTVPCQPPLWGMPHFPPPPGHVPEGCSALELDARAAELELAAAQLKVAALRAEAAVQQARTDPAAGEPAGRSRLNQVPAWGMPAAIAPPGTFAPPPGSFASPPGGFPVDWTPYFGYHAAWNAPAAPAAPSQPWKKPTTRKSAQSSAKAESEYTTVMLRNLPNDYTRDMLLQLLDSEGFRGCYDFVYLPIDFKKRAGLGYAFVNLATNEDAQRIRKDLQGYSKWLVSSQKVLEISWSTPLQGLAANIERYRNSPVMHPDVPEHFKPLLFKNGEISSFPGPTRKLRPPTSE